MLQSNAFQFKNEIPWQDLGNGIYRQVFGYDDKVMLVKVKFDKGAIGVEHEHYHSQVTYVDSGVFEMTIGTEKKIIQKGDGYYVSPHVRHGIVCLEPGMLIDVFSPYREDFI
ncbi:MAG: cupin domain-containing protein [Bacteroidota bacterium]|nr:cupin domain-containing protein [Bacteroidota bacterium]